MYQVLARKWRPQSLDDLVGQPHVVRTLRNALASGRVAHAYVFAGLRGTGKTTVARILAKSLNCETGPTAAPCNRCVPCREITEGRALDVMELDAASRTGVDNIRELQEVVSYAPVRDRYRILIIDEAHMLSKAAFNALLKTLEEPPPQVVFVLATTEVQRLLPTILSRCQVFEFRRLPVREVADHLRHIADAEGLSISERTLDGIARAGEGSVRDALSVLERVYAFCGASVDDEEARQVLGTVRQEVLEAFIRAIAARDAGALLSALDGVVEQGHDLLTFWGELLGVVRDLLLLRSWPEAGDVLSRPPNEAAALAASGAPLSVEDWTRVFQILAALEFGLKSSSQPRFLFESALIRIASLANLVPIETVLASLRDVAPAAGAGRAPSARTEPHPQKKKTDPESPATSPHPARAPDPALLARGMDETREAVIAAVAKVRPMLGVMLEQAESVVLDGESLRVRFGLAEDGVRRMLDGEDHRRTVETLLAHALGRPVLMKVLGGAESEPASSSVTRARSSAPEPVPPPRSVAGGPESKPALMDRARRDPAVRKLLDEFGAQIVDVRPVEPPAPTAETGSALEETP